MASVRRDLAFCPFAASGKTSYMRSDLPQPADKKQREKFLTHASCHRYAKCAMVLTEPETERFQEFNWI
jgi:hypothetical protein